MVLSSHFSGEEGDDSLKWIFSNNGLPVLVPGIGTKLQRKRESVTWALVGGLGELGEPRGKRAVSCYRLISSWCSIVSIQHQGARGAGKHFPLFVT